MNNAGCFLAPLHGPDNSLVAGHDVTGQKDLRVVRPAVGKILLSGFQLRAEAAQIRELPTARMTLSAFRRSSPSMRRCLKTRLPPSALTGT